ncbi:hypothetical protein FBF27_04015 [Candidatus Saccharibacteria bacterium oral taxon 488]|nr:hypothetical protein FBF27_04015 [Candidatus Saccharibacteria bacterium oral taxon 488]
MSELSQTGERDRKLTAEEWEKVERDVDMGYLSYDDAWRKLGLEPPPDQNAPSNSQLSSGQNVSADKKPRPHQRSYFAAFDTRTGDAMSAYVSKQESSDDKWGEISRRGAAMARAALRNA